jgi:hypothetical protein
MDYPKIAIEIDGITVEGMIIKREKFHIEVEITSPFNNYRNYWLISGMCRGTKDHFLTEFGEKVALDTLKNIYKKLDMIDRNIEREILLYQEYLAEISQTSYIPKYEVSDRVRSKLEDWLFHNIFVSSVTNLIASHNERPQLFKILEAYRLNKVKLYKQTGDFEKYTKNGWRIILP